MAEKDTKNTSRKKRTLGKLGSAAPPSVAEQVPDWLRLLLGKYGEAQGILVGLHDEPPPLSAVAVAGAAAGVSALLPSEDSPEDVSALLEQMAEEGPSTDEAARTATSVEWGSQPASEPGQGSPAIDDILSDIGTSTQTEPFEAEDTLPASDWLSEISESDETLEIESSRESEADLPDWLDETAPAATAIAATEAELPITTEDVPDWLNDELSPPATNHAPAHPSVAEEDQFDVPEWLTEAIDTPPPPPDTGDMIASHTTLPDEADAEETFDVPDWLTGMVPDTVTSDDVSAQTVEDVPEQLDDITDWDVPDWISDGTESPVAPDTNDPSPFTDVPTEAESSDTVFTVDPDDSDRQSEPDQPSPDWLPSIGSIPAAVAEEDTDLTQGAELEAVASETATSISSDDDWLSGLRDNLPEGDVDDSEQQLSDAIPSSLEMAEPGAEIPDWITGEPEVNEVPSLETESPDLSLSQMSRVDAPPPEELPDWLAGQAEELDVPHPAAEEQQIAPSDDDLEMPDWLSDLPDADTDEATEEQSGAAVGLAGAALAGTALAGAAALAGHDDAPAVDDPQTAEMDDDLEIPDWLSSTDEDSRSALEDDAPDWLTDIADTDEATEEQSGAAAGLAGAALAGDALAGHDDAPAADDPQTAEMDDDLEIPDWLSSTDEDSGSALEDDAPDWLTDIADTADAAPPVADTETAEAPDWLSGLPDADTDDDTTDWLTDIADTDEATEEPSGAALAGAAALAGHDDAHAADDPQIAEMDDDLEIPDWLSSTDEDSGSALQDDAPDWLTGIADTTDAAPPVADTETDEAPDWLSDLPDADTDDDTPDWLTDITDTDEATEEPSGAALAGAALAGHDDAPDVEDDSPDWLSSLRTTEDDTPLDEDDTPDWLTDIADTTDAAPPVADTETDEAPDWLSDLPDADTDDDTPDWLTDITDTDEATEEPSGAALAGAALAGHDDAPAADDPQTAEMDDDLEIPDWLSSTDEDSGSALEDDAPDWLTDIADTTDAAPPVADTETDEAPDWLSGLPDTDTDDDTPDWLTDIADTDEATEEPSGAAAGLAGAALAGAALAGHDDAPAADDPQTAEMDDDLEIPDWLSSTDEDSGSALEDDAPPVADTETDEAPDWLSGLPDTDTDDDTPDWLTDIADTDEATEEPSGAAAGLAGAALAGAAALAGHDDAPDVEDDSPDWLSSLRTTEDDTPQDEDDTPDWLTGFADTTDAAPPVADTETDEAPDWLSGLSDTDTDDDTPDWLTDIADTDEATEEPSGAAAGLAGAALAGAALTGAAALAGHDDAPDVEDDSPDWLSSLRTAEDDTPQDDDDTPDWLTGFADTTDAAPPVADTETDEAPDWLSGLPDTDTDDDTPDWLTDIADTDEATEEPSGAAALAGHDDAPDVENDSPDWLSSLRTAEDDTPQDEDDTPDWLTGFADTTDAAPPVADTETDEAPDWLSGLSDTDTDDDTPDWLTDITDTDEATEEPSGAAGHDDTPGTEVDSDGSDELVLPSWLQEDKGEDADAPDDTIPPPEPPPQPPSAGDGPGASSAEEGDSPAKKSEGGSSPDADSTKASETVEGSPTNSANLDVPTSQTGNQTDTDRAGTVMAAAAAAGTITVATAAVTGPAESAAAGRMAGWLESLKSNDEPSPLSDAPHAAEATGMLSGISTFLPSEKVDIPTAVVVDDTATLSLASREFFRIATTPPQPTALPQKTSQQEKMAAGFVRSALYLLFIVLIALPLIPGLQKVVEPETDLRVPWTEPLREYSDVLDSQRRQLISEQLGIIDLQPPDSVALVSFDFSTATQGEMQPIADAIIGRLQGQGMRIISISLEPEGATIAQSTLDNLASDSSAAYGENLVNLGYLPGQAVAVRRLATGQQKLADIPDYQDNLTFSDAARQNWHDIQNLGQVDVIVTLTDNAASGRWWVEQMETATPADDGERFLLAGASAAAEPFLSPYRTSNQLNGLIAGINGAAAIEAGRRTFGPARQMIDSLSIAHLVIVILIAVGTIVGWMPTDNSQPPPKDVNNQERGAL
jgi:hypothetical protein